MNRVELGSSEHAHLLPEIIHEEVVWRPHEKFDPNAINKIMETEARWLNQPSGTVYYWEMHGAVNTPASRLELFPDSAVIRLHLPKQVIGSMVEYETREYHVRQGLRVKRIEDKAQLVIPYSEPGRIGVLLIDRSGACAEAFSNPSAASDDLWSASALIDAAVISGKPRVHSENSLTLSEVAGIVGIPGSTLRRFCKIGRVRAVKHGHSWFVDKESLADLVRSGNIRRR